MALPIASYNRFICFINKNLIKLFVYILKYIINPNIKNIICTINEISLHFALLKINIM